MDFNSNIEFSASLVRPKKGISFEPGNEYVKDLEDAVSKFNKQWDGLRQFEILGYEGITVKMMYRSVDLVRKKRTIVKYLQEISRTLAYEKDWNTKVTRKPGAIFTVEFDTSVDQLLSTTHEEAKKGSTVDQEFLKQLAEEIVTQLDGIISQKMEAIAEEVKAMVLDNLKTITTTIVNGLEGPGNIEIIIKKG